MAQQTINIGASPNDGTGTPLRTAFQYTNSNFSELYTAVGPSGNNIVVPGNATITGDLTVATDRLKVVTASTAIQTGATTQLQVGTTSWPSTVIGKSGSRSLFGNAGEVIIWNETAAAIGNYSTLFVAAKTGAGATTMGGLQIRAGIENASNSDGFVSLWTSNSAAGGFVERYKIDSTGVATWSNVGGVAGTAMTLNANGLGIGVTPSAWGIYKGLQVGYASLAGYAGSDTLLGSNVYFDGGAFRYIAAGLASSYRQLAGGHQWSTAVAGANPGDPLTLLPQMTLDASGNLSLANGNLVMGTSGKGIDFSATSEGSGTMTSELLSDYEEGTWTPVVADAPTGGNTGTCTINSAKYTKIGRVVSVECDISGVTTTGMTAGNGFNIRGLPFVPVNGANGNFYTYRVGRNASTVSSSVYAPGGVTALQFYLYTASSGTADLRILVSDIVSTTSQIIVSVTYFV